MFSKKTLILSMLLLISFINISIAKQVTFKGTVVDSQGNPIAGAKAQLYDISYGFLEYFYDIKNVFEEKSDADGKFTFTLEVADGDYSSRFIVVEKDGLALDCFRWDISETDSGAKFALGSPIELSGIVINQNDKPVSGSSVSVLMMRIGDPQDGHSITSNVATKILNTITDADGKFTFTNLSSDAGVAFIIQKEGRATVSTYVSGSPASEHFKYSPGQENIRIIQPEEARLEGIAIDKSSGKPLAGIPLMLRGNNNYQIMGQDIIKTDENGQFSMRGICAGTYNIICVPPRIEPSDWLAQPVNFNLEAGQTIEDMKVELIKGGLLEVLVTEAGSDKLLEGATVLIYNNQRTRSFAQRTDKQGIARIRLLPGVYELGQVFRDDYSSYMAQNSVSIEEGSSKHLEVQLSSKPKASGVVRDENGKPIHGAKLSVLPGGDRNIESDEEGKFVVNWDTEMFSDERDIPLLVFRYEEGNLAKVVILEGDIENLDIKLEPGITLTGKATDPEGNGIDNAGIRMMLRQAMWSSTFISNDTINIDAEGNFEVKAIPAGYSYEITVKADGYGSLQKDIHANDAVDNILDAGTFVLPIANLSVSGVVVDVEGNPIPNARIESYNHEGGQPEHLNTRTDSKGKFILKGVCEGNVDIRVNATMNERRVTARAIADGGTSDIKIVARERGEYVTQRFTNKTYEQIILESEKVISGVVVDEHDSPVSGIPVVVNCIKREQKDRPGKYYWSYSAYEHLSSITDEEGRFVIVLDEDAQYDLLFSAYYFAPMLVYDIPAGKKDLKVVLPKGGTISGQLLRMEGDKKIPIPDVEIKLEQTDRASYTHLGFDRDQTAITDSQGKFKFEYIRTKIRPHQSMSQSEWKYIPRVWQLVYGNTTKTFAFYDSNVIDDFEFVIEPDLTNTKQLTGNTLPDFEGIKIDFDKETTKNKNLLICFFDVEQRPSRSCILELSKKAEELKTKEIELLLIHASKIENEYLDNWLKEYDISFPVGMIETGEEQTKFKWGVKALPWLILTDKECIVTNEGFSINELDEKIKE